MKKWIAVLLSVISMMMILAGCSHSNSNAALVGTWNLYTIQIDGDTYTYTDYEQLCKVQSLSIDDYSVEIEFRDDDSFTSTIAGEKGDGTFTVTDDKIILDFKDNTLSDTECTYKNDQITIKFSNDDIITLEKQ